MKVRSTQRVLQNKQLLGSLLRLAVPLVLLASLPRTCHACYSGLLDIPTADTVGANKYSVEFQVDGTTRRLRTDTYILNTQIGIGPRLELGADFDLQDKASERVYFNAKYILIDRDNSRFGLAVGVANATPTARVERNPFVVATNDFGPFRGTFGASYIDRRTQAIIGIDKTVGSRMTLMADYTTGSDNQSSTAFCYQATEHFAIQMGVEIPNSNLNERRFSVHFVFGGTHGTGKEVK